MILRRSALLFALALVLAQQLAALHGLTHAIEQTRGLAHDATCETCFAVALLDNPIVDALEPRLGRAEGAAATPAQSVSAAIASGGQAPYRSRAPPRAG